MRRPPTELLEPGRFKLTDMGNAERLARAHGGDLRYVRAWKSWLWWDGSRWCRDAVGVVTIVAKHVIRGLYEEAAALAPAAASGDEQAAEASTALTSWARRCETAGRLRDMVQLAETEQPIPAAPDVFDRDGWLLNCLNGTIDLRTGDLRTHRQEDMITLLAPVTYDPDARAPTWERFLDRILPDPGVRAWVQRFIGYSLTGDVGEQILTFLWGGGANGKSTFLGAIQSVLGDYALQAPPGLLLAQEHGGDEIGRRQRALLLGRRFVICQEIEAGRYLNETTMKQVTGGDKITAARLYESEFEFLPTHKIAVATNHKPFVRGQDHAVWRRIRLVPFTVTIPTEERDPGLPAKLAAEAPGILAWCVRGCLAWRREKLTPPDAIRVATDDYRVNEDRLGEFLSMYTVGDPAADVLLAELHRRHSGWCSSRDERPPRWTGQNRPVMDRSNPAS